MIKLALHFQRMQDMAAQYLTPEPYQGFTPAGKQLLVGSESDDKDAFINDMIYMLDGPEQREAQAELQDACPGHVASHTDKTICRNCGIHINELRPDEG